MTSPGPRLRVLTVGPDPDGRGGMVTVTRLMLRHTADVADLTAIRTHVDGSVARRLWAWGSGSAQVLARLLGRRVDVVHLHVSRRGSILRKLILAHAAAATRTPLVVHCHAGQFADEFRAMPRPLQRVVASGLRRADRLVVLGEGWRRSYVELIGVAPERVVVLTNPVELPTHVPYRPATPVRVAYLGRMEQAKGTFDLLDAVASLPPAVRERMHLSMAGDGDVEGTRSRVRAAGLTGTVEVAGWFTTAQRDAALAAASVFVLPSYHEGLPMAMLEAMAAGVVPVVSPVGSIPEIVVDELNGLLVEPGDVPGLAKALQRLVEDPELVARMAGAARRSAEGHGTGPFVRRLVEVWDAARTSAH